jgi:hypothetical protein
MRDPREKTWELIGKDLDAATKFAEAIQDPWRRVQALAMVASRTTEQKRFTRITQQALNTAKKFKEPNRIVTCSAWIVRAMAERYDVDIKSVVNVLLESIASESNPVRRADALLILFEAVYRRSELRTTLLAALLNACNEMNSWKRDRILADTARVLAVDEMPEARKVIRMINNDSIKRKAESSVERQESLGPHDFWPYYAKPVN